DLSSGAPLARLGDNHDRLAGGEHRVEACGADTDPLLPSGLLQSVELRPVEELGENLGNLLFDDARSVVFDQDAVPVFADLVDLDQDGGQDASLLTSIEGVVDGFFDGGEEGLGRVVEPE